MVTTERIQQTQQGLEYMKDLYVLLLELNLVPGSEKGFELVENNGIMMAVLRRMQSLSPISALTRNESESNKIAKVELTDQMECQIMWDGILMQLLLVDDEISISPLDAPASEEKINEFLSKKWQVKKVIKKDAEETLDYQRKFSRLVYAYQRDAKQSKQNIAHEYKMFSRGKTVQMLFHNFDRVTIKFNGVNYAFRTENFKVYPDDTIAIPSDLIEFLENVNMTLPNNSACERLNTVPEYAVLTR